jgi:hypothetical protein
VTTVSRDHLTTRPVISDHPAALAKPQVRPTIESRLADRFAADSAAKVFFHDAVLVPGR